MIHYVGIRIDSFDLYTMIWRAQPMMKQLNQFRGKNRTLFTLMRWPGQPTQDINLKKMNDEIMINLSIN